MFSNWWFVIEFREIFEDLWWRPG